jgi:flagellar hook-basal body complex protein FliE
MVAASPADMSPNNGPKAALFGQPEPCGPPKVPSTMTDMRLKPFDFQAAVARAGLRPDGMPLSGGAGGVQGAQGGFKAAMASALNQVSQSQLEASRMQREVTLGNPEVSLEETMVSMQKAQIGFQATLQVRNRLVQAYSEIMNMQV